MKRPSGYMGMGPSDLANLSPGIPPTYLSDTFTDTNGVTIQVHAMDFGGPWHLLQGIGTIQSNKLESGTSGTPLIVSATSGYSDCVVSANDTLPASGNVCVGVLGRMSDVNTGWALVYENDGTGLDVTLYELAGVM